MAFYKTTPTSLFSDADFAGWTFKCDNMKENCTRNEEMNVTNISEENDDASSKRQRTEWSMNCIFYLTRKIEDQFCSLWKVFSSFISIFIVWQRCSCNFISIPVTHRTSVNAISKGFEEIVSIIYRNWLANCAAYQSFALENFAYAFSRNLFHFSICSGAFGYCLYFFFFNPSNTICI